MNKRIRELAEQAGYQADMFGIGHWDMPECKKFAELIVRQCCDIFVELRARPADLAVKDVKKHFGVE
jgi:hypothetical protein